jgi:transposase
MKPYSNDLRAKIVAAYDANNYSQREVAQLFGVSESTVRKLLRRKRQQGSTDALPHSGGQPLRADHRVQAFVVDTLKHNNDRTLQELCDSVEEHYSIRLSLPAMCRLLQRLNLPRKKNTARQ